MVMTGEENTPLPWFNSYKANRIIAIQFDIAIESIIARSLYRCSLQAYKMRYFLFTEKLCSTRAVFNTCTIIQNALQYYPNEFYDELHLHGWHEQQKKDTNCVIKNNTSACFQIFAVFFFTNSIWSDFNVCTDFSPCLPINSHRIYNLYACHKCLDCFWNVWKWNWLKLLSGTLTGVFFVNGSTHNNNNQKLNIDFVCVWEHIVGDKKFSKHV